MNMREQHLAASAMAQLHDRLVKPTNFLGYKIQVESPYGWHRGSITYPTWGVAEAAMGSFKVNRPGRKFRIVHALTKKPAPPPTWWQSWLAVWGIYV